MGAVSKIFEVIIVAEVGVDMEDAFEACRETKDVLIFGACPDNIVVDPLNIFGSFNLDNFFESMKYEGDMLVASLQEKPERADWVLGRDQERERIDKLVKEFNDLGEEMFKTPLIRLDEECSHYNLEELGKMLRSLVGRVIVSSILEVPDVLIKYSKIKWAENLDEEKIERAIELAGKVSALLEKLVEERNSIHPEMASHESGARASESGDIEVAAGPTQ